MLSHNDKIEIAKTVADGLSVATVLGAGGQAHHGRGERNGVEHQLAKRCAGMEFVGLGDREDVAWPDLVEQIAEEGHEIGHHGWTHVPPNDMTREQEESGMVRANELIRKLTGQYARGYRSPGWDLSPNSVELFIKHGFTYDTSMMGDDYGMYYARQGDVLDLHKPAQFGKTTPLVELPISWSTDDAPHFEYMRTGNAIRPGMAKAGDVLENWIADFDYMQKTTDWGVLTFTCHPFISGRGYVTPQDVKSIAHDVLRHRVLVSYEAEAEELNSELIIDKILSALPVP